MVTYFEAAKCSPQTEAIVAASKNLYHRRNFNCLKALCINADQAAWFASARDSTFK